jgi:hypothetical protein
MLCSTRINVITPLPYDVYWGPPMETFIRAGVDSLTMIYQRHMTQLTLKLPNNFPYVEDAVSTNLIPLSYAHFPMPIIGLLFNLYQQPQEVVNYSDGAYVSMATGGDHTSLV